MVNSAFDPLADAGDFRFQCGDAPVQFVDRQRIEVLAGQLGDHVAGAAGKIVGFHDADR